MKAKLITLFACLLLASIDLMGQAIAQIHGTVQDTSGAGIPGAAVKATQTETGLARSTRLPPEPTGIWGTALYTPPGCGSGTTRSPATSTSAKGSLLKFGWKHSTLPTVSVSPSAARLPLRPVSVITTPLTLAKLRRHNPQPALHRLAAAAESCSWL